MDKQTLSNYGWLVIVTLILAVMLALATPFGTYVGDGVVSIANGYVQASDNAIDEDNIGKVEDQWDSKFDYSGFEGYQDPAEKSAKLNPNGIIPEGAVYYVQPTNKYIRTTMVADTVLHAGEKFPEPQIGDAYIFEGLEYRYNQKPWSTSYTNFFDTDTDGWSVITRDKKSTNFGEILESIAGKPITNTANMFYRFECDTIPSINMPSTVTNMELMFAYSQIQYLPQNFRIPNGVTNLYCMFTGSKIITLPDGFTIPNSVTKMQSMFESCVALTKLPQSFKISENIVDAKYVFMGCKSLMEVSKMFTKTADDADFNKFFGGCTALTQLPEGFTLPQNNINAYLMFNKTGLTSLPDSFVIYEYMTKTSEMFLNSYSLSGSITVDSDYVCQNFIANTQITEIKGKTTKADEWLKTKVFYDETQNMEDL